MTTTSASPLVTQIHSSPLKINTASISPLKRKAMTLTQTYQLAHMARTKLTQEAGRAEHRLSRLVGHANMLDSLMLDLQAAEEEQEQWFNNTVKSAVAASRTTEESVSDLKTEKEASRHVMWADKVHEAQEQIRMEVEQEMELDDSEEEESDSDSEISDYDMDDDFVALARVPSHHSAARRAQTEEEEESSDFKMSLDEIIRQVDEADSDDEVEDEEDEEDALLYKSPSSSTSSTSSSPSDDTDITPPLSPSTSLPDLSDCEQDASSDEEEDELEATRVPASAVPTCSYISFDTLLAAGKCPILDSIRAIVSPSPATPEHTASAATSPTSLPSTTTPSTPSTTHPPLTPLTPAPSTLPLQHRHSSTTPSSCAQQQQQQAMARGGAASERDRQLLSGLPSGVVVY